MSEKKYQVFISSTYKDLINHRLAVAKSILDLGHIPAAMEYFPAMDEDQLKYIRRIIDQCDYYILIVAGKYGSMDSEGISYTEREYDYAVETGKFVLGFPYKNIENMPRNMTEDDSDVKQKLENFRNKIMRGRLVRMWEDEKDLDLNVTKALSIAFREYPQTGWVRSPTNSSEDLLQEIVNLRRENDILKSEIEKLASSPVIQVDNLVGLDTEYSFMMQHMRNQHVYAIKLTWLRLFMIIASILKPSTGIYYIRKEIDEKVRPFISNAPFGGGINYSIVDEYLNVILAQLYAHGLIYTEDRSNYRITRKGEEIFLVNSIVRQK